MEFEIRQTGSKDLKKVQELNDMLFKYEIENNFDTSLDSEWPKKNEKYFKDSIEGKNNNITFVAEDNGKAIGYIICKIHKAEDYRKIKIIGEIENMFVIQDYRGKGIGKLLINEAIDWFKNNNISKVSVTVSSGNKRSIKFYEDNNFSSYDIVMERDI